MSPPRQPTPATRAAPDGGALAFRVHDAIDEIDRERWDGLVADTVAESADPGGSPFLRWAWLEALEHSGCASAEAGWKPQHLAVYRDGRLVAAAPAYLRNGSDGDFSRDWGYADAAMRAGLRYYPKLSITVPFTPVRGPRLLVAAGEDRAACAAALYAGAEALAHEVRCGAIQVLFPVETELPALESAGFILNLSYQFHWKNRGYADNGDFLARFDAKRRHQLKRESSAAARQGIDIRTVRGNELAADPRRWAHRVFALHSSTVKKLMWGRGWLNRAFYERVFAHMPEAFEVVTATRAGAPLDGEIVAGAFNVATPTRLFGRYWGCHEDHPFLHFNVCLYHSVGECIQRKVQVFEGGAGGEHKLARGFEPSETWSALRFFDPRLEAAVRQHLARDNAALASSLERWRSDMPIFKKSPATPADG